MPFNLMIEEVSSILWGLSIAVNIILLLIGLPLCLLICCCCRKHQDTLEKDIRMIARNHNILQDSQEEDVPPIKQYPQRQQIQNSYPVQRKKVNVEEVNNVDLPSQPSFNMTEE